MPGSPERIAGVEALFDPVNKSTGASVSEAEGMFPELTSEATDAELLENARKWKAAWEPVEGDLKRRGRELEGYWLGFEGAEGYDRLGKESKPFPDNLIYEALETFLPKATQKSPEPVVTADGTAQGDLVARTVEKTLVSIAESKDVDLRMVLRAVARFHQLRFVGAVKVGWSETTRDVTATAILPESMVMDPESTVEAGAYTGRYLGLRDEPVASDLLLRFPEKEAEISEACDGKLSTKLKVCEWWTAGQEPIVFWVMGEGDRSVVLGKMRNPHFNYPEPVESVDEFGQVTVTEQPGRNYFARPRIPVEILSIANLGRRPFDLTNGLWQCASMQDVVSKRWKQIDRNADNTNNGLAVSGDAFDPEQAADAALAARNGDVLWVPEGPVGDAVQRLTGEPLPSFVYENLVDARARILSVYGVSGSIPSFLQKDSTVRGKMMTKGADDDRIGGGFTEYLEKLAARVYEQFVQFMHVYYDEPKMASAVGKERATEYFTLARGDLAAVRLSVSVREGSMVPKDAMTRRNEALELWGASALDPISLFSALDFPNPRESARSLFLWQTNPAALFPELAAVAPQPVAGAPPPGAPEPPPPQGMPADPATAPLPPIPDAI